MIAAATIIRLVRQTGATRGASLSRAFVLMALAMVINPSSALAQTTSGQPGHADSAFVAGLSDVPVMPGLKPDSEQPLVFDKPGARIVDTMLTGAVDQRAVLSFYTQTLPQLGWMAAPARSGSAGREARFRREGEELSVDVRGAPGRTTVHFRLSPQ